MWKLLAPAAGQTKFMCGCNQNWFYHWSRLYQLPSNCVGLKLGAAVAIYSILLVFFIVLWCLCLSDIIVWAREDGSFDRFYWHVSKHIAASAVLVRGPWYWYGTLACAVYHCTVAPLVATCTCVHHAL